MRILQLALIGLIFIAKPAFADAQMAAQRCEPAGGTGATVDIGVACANSWLGSGQVLFNTIKFGSAGDNEAQSSVDFVLGGSDAAASNDPTFVGRAGHKGAYFSFDGGDFLKYTGQTGGDQTVVDGFADDWHKTTGGKDYFVGLAFCYESNATLQTIFTTKATGANQGITGYINANGELSVTQRGATASPTVSTDTNLMDGNCYAVGFSTDVGTINTRIWTTSTTSELLSLTFNTGTGAATSPLVIGASFDATITTPSLYLEAGTKVYDIMIDNTYYSDADFAAWVADVEARDGINFTS